ncbi:uncharacterized protein LOC101850641 [Aplysia californica]|uniref:Uncharacterized protein LOC101850641 n=1 Tax=Aplysia californica TaxID=6500 RepID=A0ABM0JKX7_APLCA|nr:uncharacterized protein LOC101850641 [Aplysia californica]
MARAQSSALFLLLLIGWGTISSGDRTSDIIDRLSALEEKVNTLEHEVRRLKDKDTAKSNCETEAVRAEKGGEETNAEVVGYPEVKILEARREIVPNGVMFTVRYSTDGQHPLFIEWRDKAKNNEKLEDLEDDPRQQYGPGVRESRVITSSRNGSVGVIINGLTAWNSLVLANDGKTDLVQTDIPELTLKVTPPGDLVYEPGRNLTMKIEILKPGRDSFNSPTFVLIDPETGDLNITTREPPSVIATDIKKTDLLDTQELEATLMTSVIPTRGVIVLTVGRHHMDEPESLVRMILKSRLVVLRASNQAGPFPEGFLQVSTDDAIGKKINGVHTTFCVDDIDDSWNNCFIGCYGVGPDLSEVTLEQLLLDGSRKEVASETTRPGEYLMYVHTSPQPDEHHSDIRYQCRAVDNRHGAVVRQDYLVKFYVPANVIEEESGAFWVNATTLEIRCVVRSNTEPDIDIRLNPYLDGVKGDAVVVRKSDHKFVSSAFFDLEQVTRPFRLHTNNYFGMAECGANKEVPIPATYNHGTFLIDIPRPPLPETTTTA